MGKGQEKEEVEPLTFFRCTPVKREAPKHVISTKIISIQLAKRGHWIFTCFPLETSENILFSRLSSKQFSGSPRSFVEEW